MKKMIILFLVFTVIVTGCAKKEEANLNPPPPGATPAPATPGVTTSQPNEVPLNILSTATLSEFAKWPLNSPTNVKLTISLHDFGAPSNGSAHRYGGSLKISFQDGAYNIASQFTTGGSLSDAIYNYWMVLGGKNVFRAFFEDEGRPFKKVSGGLVLVIDEVFDLGDGATEPIASGSIWFLNFEESFAPQADKRCWFVQIGPYDCRAFLVGNSIDPSSRLYPELRQLSTGHYPGYKKLGTFSNLSLSKAFN